MTLKEDDCSVLATALMGAVVMNMVVDVIRIVRFWLWWIEKRRISDSLWPKSWCLPVRSW